MKNYEKEIKNYFLNARSLWDNVPLIVSKILKENSTTLTFKKNETIYKEGTIPKGVYIIKSGFIKLSIIDNQGREQIIFLLTKNEMFGYRFILGESTNQFYANALEDCEIEFISREKFLILLDKTENLKDFLVKSLLADVRVLLYKISFFSLKPVMERVALSILIVNLKMNEKNSEKGFSIGRKDLANFAGTIIETLSRQLKFLIDEKTIKVDNRHITIINFKKLYDIANIE